MEDNIRRGHDYCGKHVIRDHQVPGDWPQSIVKRQLLMAGGGVDEGQNLMAAGKQEIDEMRTGKACRPSNENTHKKTPLEPIPLAAFAAWAGESFIPSQL
jgi:hypothetical protein